jgi:hypothetical protein
MEDFIVISVDNNNNTAYVCNNCTPFLNFNKAVEYAKEGVGDRKLILNLTTLECIEVFKVTVDLSVKST